MGASDGEWVDLIDPGDRVIGWARRAAVRRRNLLHRGVGVVCLNSRGEVYVHRRTSTKDVFPSMYDMFVGGVVGSGETYDSAARREISEELGMTGVALEPVAWHLYRGPRNRSRVRVYRVVWDGPVRWQADEVDWGRWMAPAELEAWIATRRFVPDGLAIWRALPEEARTLPATGE